MFFKKNKKEASPKFIPTPIPKFPAAAPKSTPKPRVSKTEQQLASIDNGLTVLMEKNNKTSQELLKARETLSRQLRDIRARVDKIMDSASIPVPKKMAGGRTTPLVPPTPTENPCEYCQLVATAGRSGEKTVAYPDKERAKLEIINESGVEGRNSYTLTVAKDVPASTWVDFPISYCPFCGKKLGDKA